jgi:hypothetical protein
VAEERRYTLTKVEAGDYLLPSNDGRSLWRIKRATELEPVRSGVGELEHETTREVHVWEAWRYIERWTGYAVGRVVELPDDFLEWQHWSLEESWHSTRAEAIAAAIRISAS